MTPAGPSPVRSNMPTPSPEPMGSGNIRIPMTLRPTWLPEDMVELRRRAQRGGVDQTRVWATAGAMAAAQSADAGQASLEGYASLIIHPEPTAEPSPSGSPSAQPQPQPRPFANATVGHQPAWLDAPTGGAAHLEWYLEPDVLVMLDVSAIANSGEVALRMANALVPDPVAGCETSLRLGWLPPLASQVRDIDISGWNGEWTQSVWTRPTANIGYEPVWAQLVSDRSQLSDFVPGDPVSIQGRPGFASRGGGAAVELDGGRWLRVFGKLEEDVTQERDCAVRVANDLVVGPDPYLGWIGRR